jgi:hypothetical protein
MASAELSRRVEKVVGYPPLSEMGEKQRREFQEALLDADTFEDLPGKWQAAILRWSKTCRSAYSAPDDYGNAGVGISQHPDARWGASRDSPCSTQNRTPLAEKENLK